VAEVASSGIISVPNFVQIKSAGSKFEVECTQHGDVSTLLILMKESWLDGLSTDLTYYCTPLTLGDIVLGEGGRGEWGAKPFSNPLEVHKIHDDRFYVNIIT
jgi:hypothetical protein